MNQRIRTPERALWRAMGAQNISIKHALEFWMNNTTNEIFSDKLIFFLQKVRKLVKFALTMLAAASRNRCVTTQRIAAIKPRWARFGGYLGGEDCWPCGRLLGAECAGFKRLMFQDKSWLQVREGSGKGFPIGIWKGLRLKYFELGSSCLNSLSIRHVRWVRFFISACSVDTNQNWSRFLIFWGGNCCN